MTTKHLHSLDEVEVRAASLVTIGVFDGLHLGHQTLIHNLVQEAHSRNALAVVLTFFPHPDLVLKNISDRYYLTTPEQRATLLLEMGVDYVITHPFDEQVRRMSALDFVDRLLTHLNMVALWIGPDFALGYQRQGNVDFLRQQGIERGFELKTIQPVAYDSDGTMINSTTLRDWLRQGYVERARQWLGRAYSVVGTVGHGQKRGRSIGFPTANLRVWSQQIIPANGVYAGWASVAGEKHMAVTNVGTRPTFGEQDVTVETYLLDFSGDLYDKSLELSFEVRLRGEQRFSSIEELIHQIEKDVRAGREYLEQQSQPSSPGLDKR